MPLTPLPPGVSGERPRRGGLLPSSAFFFAIPVAPASLCHSPRAPRVPPPRSVRKSESSRRCPRPGASPRAFRPSDLAVMKVSCRTRASPPVSRRPRVPDTRPTSPARSPSSARLPAEGTAAFRTGNVVSALAERPGGVILFAEGTPGRPRKAALSGPGLWSMVPFSGRLRPCRSRQAQGSHMKTAFEIIREHAEEGAKLRLSFLSDVAPALDEAARALARCLAARSSCAATAEAPPTRST